MVSSSRTKHTQQWTDARDKGFAAIARPDNNPLAQGDREDALTDWLEDYGVNDAWKLAEPLAAGHIEPQTLDRLIDCWHNDGTEMRDIRHSLACPLIRRHGYDSQRTRRR